MKRITPVVLAATLLTLSSCKSKNDANDDATAPATEAAAPAGPSESTSPLTRTDTIGSGSGAVIVSLSRSTDRSLPTVRDENDTEFYDNCVEITATRGGEEILRKRMTKADFESLLGDSERRMGVLQGMALVPEKCTASSLALSAQVGQPGLDGEGPAFNVTIALPSGKTDISKDNNQNAMLEELEGD